MYHELGKGKSFTLAGEKKVLYQLKINQGTEEKCSCDDLMLTPPIVLSYDYWVIVISESFIPWDIPILSQLLKSCESKGGFLFLF